MPKKAQGSKVSLTYNANPPPKIPKRFLRSKEQWTAGGEWVPVMSSNVVGMMYEPGSQTLFVGFNPSKNKPRVRVYAYRGVGAILAEDMYNVSSMGGFVWQRLRNAGIAGVEVAEVRVPTWLYAASESADVSGVEEEKAPSFYSRD